MRATASKPAFRPQTADNTNHDPSSGDQDMRPDSRRASAITSFSFIRTVTVGSGI